MGLAGDGTTVREGTGVLNSAEYLTLMPRDELVDSEVVVRERAFSFSSSRFCRAVKFLLVDSGLAPPRQAR